MHALGLRSATCACTAGLFRKEPDSTFVIMTLGKLVWFFWAIVSKTVALCYQTVVCPACLSVLSVMLVHCGQTVGRIKMKLNVPQSWPHCVRRGPSLQSGTAPHFSAHICCGQMAACIKMPLGLKVGLGPDDFVLDRDPAPLSQKGQSPPQVSAHFVAKRMYASRCYLLLR